MVTVGPNELSKGVVRDVDVDAGVRGVFIYPRNSPAIPAEATAGDKAYIADPLQFLARVRANLATNPSRWLAGLAAYTYQLSEAATSQRGAAPARSVDQPFAPVSNLVGVAAGETERQGTARAKLALLRQPVQELLTSGKIPAPEQPGDAASLLITARSLGIPLGQVRVSISNTKQAAELERLARASGLTDAVIDLRGVLDAVRNGARKTRLVVEMVRPESIGLLGGSVVQVASGGTDTERLERYMRAAAGLDSDRPALKLAPSLVQMIASKLSLAGIATEGDVARDLISTFATGTPGSAVAAFRQMALTAPQAVPRLQRVLRNYGEASLVYDESLTLLQRITRVMSLVFGADSGLRAVQTQVMRADLTQRSQRLDELMRGRPDECVWDVAIVGCMGPHGQAAIDRIVQTNPELRVFGVDANVVSANYGRQGASFYLNSRNGQDDGRPGGDGRGNINPVGSPLLTSDLSGTQHPTPESVEDADVAGLYEATQRGHVDLLLGSRVVKVEHRSRTTELDAATWPAAFRVTMANGRIAYAHKCATANGFGGTPKPFGDAASTSTFSVERLQTQTCIARWQQGIAEAMATGAASAPELESEAKVFLAADVLTVANTPGADALAAFRCKTQDALALNEVGASSVVIGFGDSNRTVLELALGLAPDKVYRNTPAQLGQIRDLVWVVGDSGPKSCFEFLVGRDYLSKVLSEKGFAELRAVVRGEAFANLFADDVVLAKNDAILSELRSKLDPEDQKALDGARTRYQKISGAILKGLVRLEAAQATKLEALGGRDLVVDLSNGKRVRASRLIDGRGYVAELGPLAYLANPTNPNPKQTIGETDLVRIRGRVPEGVIGRDAEGLADVAKSFAGLEKEFVWIGPGHGGDLVKKEDIAKQTRVGANTVSLFVNIPRSISATDCVLAIGQTLVNTSIAERYREAQTPAIRSTRPWCITQPLGVDRLVAAEADGDSLLEVQARLTAMVHAFDMNAFKAGDTIDVAVRCRPQAQRSAPVLEISSGSLDKKTLRQIRDMISADPRFQTLLAQMLQHPDVALRLSGMMRSDGQLNLPSCKLEATDVAELPRYTPEEVASAEELLEAVASARVSPGVPVTARLDELVDGGVLTRQAVARALEANQQVSAARARALEFVLAVSRGSAFVDNFGDARPKLIEGGERGGLSTDLAEIERKFVAAKGLRALRNFAEGIDVLGDERYIADARAGDFITPEQYAFAVEVRRDSLAGRPPLTFDGSQVIQGVRARLQRFANGRPGYLENSDIFRAVSEQLITQDEVNRVSAEGAEQRRRDAEALAAMSLDQAAKTVLRRVSLGERGSNLSAILTQARTAGIIDDATVDKALALGSFLRD